MRIYEEYQLPPVQNHDTCGHDSGYTFDPANSGAKIHISAKINRHGIVRREPTSPSSENKVFAAARILTHESQSLLTRAGAYGYAV